MRKMQGQARWPLGAVSLVLLGVVAGGCVKGRKKVAQPAPAASPASQTQVPEATRAPSAPGVIEGTVASDGEDGALIDRAIVALWGADGARAAEVTKSDQSGRFRFEGVAVGDYAVTAMAHGWASVGQTVEVKAAAVTPVALRLGKGGLIVRGRVLDVGGGTVPGAEVRAFDIGDASGVRAAPKVFPATGDSAGEYQLFLAAGQYRLEAQAAGHATVSDALVVTQDVTRDLHVGPASRIEGIVVERKSRQPVPGAELWLVTDRAGTVGARDVTSDANGAFVFADLNPGVYKVSARQGRLVGMSAWIPLGASKVVKDIEVEADPGLVVSGQVSAQAGAPVTDARLTLAKTQPPFGRPLVAETDGDGGFRLEGLLPAVYRLQVTADKQARSVQDLNVSADVPDLRVTLAPGAVVQGQVLSAADVAVAGATVKVGVRPAAAGVAGVIESGVSDSDGRFFFDGLPAGEVRLMAAHKKHGLITQGAEALAAGEQKSVGLKLQEAGSIAGTVRFRDKRAAAGVRVEAIARDGRNRWTDITGPDGSYRLAPIGAGKFNVVAAPGPDAMFTASDRPDQKSLSLGANEKKVDVNLVIEPGKPIRGRVIAPGGRVLGGVPVLATAESAERTVRSGRRPLAYSAPDGTFVLEQVGGGSYQIAAAHAGFADATVRGVRAGSKNVKLAFVPESTVAGDVVASGNEVVVDYAISIRAAGPGSGGAKTPAAAPTAARVLASDVVHDPRGRFFFSRLGAGTYEIVVTTAAGGAGRQVITVGAKEAKTGVRVTVQPATRIQGRVVDHDTSAPVADVEVRGVPQSPQAARPVARTDSSGAFVLSGVTSGQSITLVITGAPDAYVVERRALPAINSSVVQAGTIHLSRGNVPKRMSEGTYAGTVAGLTLRLDDSAVIESVQVGTPAADAGIKAGDVIVSIDNEAVRGVGAGGLEHRLRGRPGTPATVMVRTGDEAPRTVTVTRSAAARGPR